MAALQDNCGDAGLARAPTTFHASLWGDFFLTHQLPTAPQHAYMRERAGLLKEEVREIIKGTHELPKILDLIVTLQRLGLDDHYEVEIDEHLRSVYDSGDYEVEDLNLVSLRFYLLRKNGYAVSFDVFLNFKDKDGNFASDDTRTLLSLYNAAHLRTHGEDLLDEAIAFTRTHLEAALPSLDSRLADEVALSLQTPLFRRVRILEARTYIPIYETEPLRNEAVLEFAKLNFNLLQFLYCEELKMVKVVEAA